MAPEKKVAVHIITFLELGGAQQNTIYTVRHLDTAEFKPVLIAGRGALLDNEARALGNTVPVYLIPHLQRPIHPLRDILAFLKIYVILKKIKPDIVHTHSSKAGILGRWAAFCARVPVILHTFHGFGFHERQNRFVRGFYVFLERFTAWITDAFICVSKNNIAYAREKKIGSNEKYHLIRSGISLADYRRRDGQSNNVRKELSLGKDDHIITMIACFKPQKNCLDFVRLAAYLKKKQDMPPHTFLLIGDGDERLKIEKEIETHGLRSVFRLPGWRKDIPAIMQMTDIFVLTSLWEGLPRAAVEALVSGVPVCAHNVDGLTEVVQHGINGYLFEPFNIPDMAEGIYGILRDENLRKELSDNAARSIGDEFDIDGMVRAQEKLYTSL